MDGCEFWTDSHVAPQKFSCIHVELDSMLIIMYIMIKRNIMCKCVHGI